MNKPLLTVFGATGRQGGAVARSVLAQGRWRVRAVTRRPQGAPAQALAALGAQLCAADLDQPDSLPAALDGAQAVFAVTNFWEHGDAERELRQARHLAQAAAGLPLQQLIWSTLEDSRSVLTRPNGQRYAVPHMDAKAEANAYFLAHDLPVTLLLTSFFWENLIEFGMGPQRADDGVLEFALPLGDHLLSGMAVADLGPVVAALLDSASGQRRFGLAGEHLSGKEMAAALAEALGEPVRWRDVPLAQYARLPFAGAAELAAMFEFKQRANAAYRAARPIATARALHPGLQDFRHWLRQHAALIPLPRPLPTLVPGA